MGTADRPHEIESLAALEQRLERGAAMHHVVLQSLDLRGHDERVAAHDLTATSFLGCTLGPRVAERAAGDGALVFPRIDDVPFDPYRGALYSPDELLGGYRPGEHGSYAQTLDGRVFAHFEHTGGTSPQSVLETLARRLHDHAISDALHEFTGGRRIVAVMGGHSTSRTSAQYRTVAETARTLTRGGVTMASGGGPGAMEATHLGALLAPHPDEALGDALEILSAAPVYTPVGPWLDATFAVLERFPHDPAAPPSLGIPTWTYGHEPPTAFASHVAKYFANSIREDGLLALATGGVVFTPGNAGTVQEIFQDAAQNHYRTTGSFSPMVFLGARYWTEARPVMAVVRSLCTGREWGEHVHLVDDPAEAVSILLAFRQSP